MRINNTYETFIIFVAASFHHATFLRSARQDIINAHLHSRLNHVSHTWSIKEVLILWDFPLLFCFTITWCIPNIRRNNTEEHHCTGYERKCFFFFLCSAVWSVPVIQALEFRVIGGQSTVTDTILCDGRKTTDGSEQESFGSLDRRHGWH